MQGKFATWSTRRGMRVSVYHEHKDGRTEPLRYWFRIQGEPEPFDVRRVPGWIGYVRDKHLPNGASLSDVEIMEFIRAAVRDGRIGEQEVQT